MRRIIALVVGVAVLCALYAGWPASSPVRAADPGVHQSSEWAPHRATLSFNPDWKFIKEDPKGAEQPGFDDSKWTTVSAPHTFNDVDTFDDLSPGGHVGELTQWMGRTWYRKHFKLDPKWKGKKVFIEFQGVRQVSEVYLNGKKLGGSQTGFTPFGFDLTSGLNWDGENVIAVMADNTFDSHKDLKSEIKGLPWNDPHWHPAHGGLYRDVILHVMDPVHVTLPLYSNLGTEGMYVYASNVSNASADVTAEAEVQNETTAAKDIEVASAVYDRNNQVVAQMKTTGKLAAGATQKFSATGKLANPELWEPAYPYLYTVRTAVMVDGVPVDGVATPLGIRYAKFTADQGFFINGHHLKLRGWGQKPTDEWPGLGAALPDWLHDYTLKLMRDAGGNYIRWGHCAGPPAGVTASDKYGILTLMPGVDGEADVKDPAIWEIRAAAFRDVVIYFRNNPSIILWEGGNQSVTEDHVKQIHGFYEKYDPHGGRFFTQRRPNAVVGKYLDVSEGTEGGDDIKQMKLPVVEGEYDREESPRRVWDNYSPPDFGYKDAHDAIKAGKPQTWDLNSEQWASLQAKEYTTKIGNPAHSGGAKWVFSDSTSGGRMTVEVARVSGNVDGVRLPKEAYYAIAAIFKDEPTVHIIGHWTYPAGTKKDIFVMSNCDDVELFVNGKSLGHGTKSFGYLFTFPQVDYQPGAIRATGIDGGKPVTFVEKHTAGEPKSVRLTSITGPDGLRADGSDIVLIDAEVVDADGNRCPTWQGRIDFTCEGPAVWRGGYNSGKNKSTNNKYLDLECGINRVAVKSTTTPGTIIVTGTVKGLPQASIQIESHQVVMKDGVAFELPLTPPQGPLKKPTGGQRTVIVDATTKPATGSGELITSFSYTGPNRPCTIQKVAGDHLKIYPDRGFVFTDLPDFLKGGEYVQAPGDDRSYSAADLMQLTAAQDIDLYLAHDDRLPHPKWITADFKDSGAKVTLGDGAATLFKRSMKKGESITLSSNMEEATTLPGQMYVVFAVKAKK